MTVPSAINLTPQQQRVEREVAEHEFIDRLFYFWDTNYRGALSFQVSVSSLHKHRAMSESYQDLVSGLDGVMFNDLMENIEWFFNLHDKNKDGFLSKDEVLTLSESLLVGGTVNCALSMTSFLATVHLPI